jgi:hypothetical protein
MVVWAIFPVIHHRFLLARKFLMQLCVLLRIVLTTLLITPAIARADGVDEHVDLVCHATADVALVRFSTAGPTYPRLPPTMDRGLSASTGPDRTDCTLPDGTTIRVRGGREQAFAYGAGGGNPPAFFSLWINQRKVLSHRIWMPGYAESSNNPPVYNGMLITANRITVCATPVEGKRQHCTSEAFNLAKAPIDRIEFAAQKAATGHISVIAKGADNQRFCESYVALLTPGIDGALQGQATSLDIAPESLNEQLALDGTHARSGLVELAPGQARRAMLWEADSHYFDGTVIALAPSRMTMQDIVAAYPIDAIDAWPTRPATSGVTLISGGQNQLYPGASPRYVHLVPQRIDGSLYVFAYPTNKTLRPTAALVKPLAGGGFATLCAFNRTEPHY